MDNFEKAIGRTISDAYIEDSSLYLNFSDGSCLKVFDDASYCCEYRYMTCDDELSTFKGAKFFGVEAHHFDEEEDSGEDCHDLMFVHVETDMGSIVLCNHNVHNGYYGGFNLETNFVESS